MWKTVAKQEADKRKVVEKKPVLYEELCKHYADRVPELEVVEKGIFKE